jgi:hypothetical protein
MKKTNLKKLPPLKKGEMRFMMQLSKSDGEILSMKLMNGAAGISYKMPNAEAITDHFGLFDAYSNNANVYVPNTVSDILPKEEDFVQVPFRLLSATIVAGATWRATEFPANVLKASTKKLLGKPVYLEHDTNLLNWVGMVRNPTWVDERMENGVRIPAGIDGIIAIDAKTNPKIVRATLSGGIFSNSVTIVFDSKPSHSFEEQWQFRDAVGTMHKDGSMVRYVATKVHEYQESSLVFLGADPYAKMRDSEGNLSHVDILHSYSHSSKVVRKDEEKEKELFKENNSYESWKIDKETLSLSEIFSKLYTNKKSIMDADKPAVTEQPSELETTLLTTLSLTDKTKISTTVESLKSTETEYAKYKADTEAAKLVQEKTVAELTAKNTELANKVAQLEADAKAGREMMEAKRAETLRLYKLSAGDKANAALESLIQKADTKELDTLIEQYTTATTGKFKGKCKDCGSSNFSFQHSQVDEPNTDKALTVEQGSYQDIREKYKNKK